MAYTFSFADNVSYGASDVNSVINKIVTKGVADVFFDGVNYNTSDLNKIAKTVAESGIIYASGASMKVVSENSGTVKVTAGSAFMADGASVTVDSDGVVLGYTEGQKNYVYIKNNLLSNNTIDIVCDLTGGGSDSVPLAEISAEGEIIDTREFCKGKLAGYQSDVNQTKIIEVPFSITATHIGESQTVTVDLGGYGYSRIVNITRAVNDTVAGPTLGYCNLYDGTYYSVCRGNNGIDVLTDRLSMYASITDKGNDTVDVVFSLNGMELECTFTAKYGKSKGETDTKTFSGTAVFLVC